VSIWSIVGVALVVPVADWIFVTGAAARFPDFDYRYWPPTKARVISVLSLALSTAIVMTFADSGSPPLWPVIPAGLAIIAWTFIGCRDIQAQRRTGYRIPPDYGERES